MPCLISSISIVSSISSKTTTSSIRPSRGYDGVPPLYHAPIAKGALSVAILFAAVPLALRTTPVPSPRGSPVSSASPHQPGRI